jgi:ATP-binding cassette, subfamily B, bacterial
MTALDATVAAAADIPGTGGPLDDLVPPARPVRARTFARYLDLVGVGRGSLLAVALLSALATAGEGAAIVTLAGLAAAVLAGQHELAVGIDALSIQLSLNIAWGFVAFGALLGLRLAAMALASKLASEVSAAAFQGARVAVLRGYAASPWPVKAGAGAGEIQDLVNTQVSRATQAVSGWISLMMAVVTSVVLIGAAIMVSAAAAVGMIAVSAVLFLILRPLVMRTRRQSQLYARNNLALSADVADALTGARDIELFGVWSPLTEALLADSESVARSFRISQLLIRLVPVAYQSAGLAIAGVFLFAVRDQAVLGAGDLGAAALLVIRSLTAGQSLQSNYQLYSSSLPFCDEVLNWIGGVGDRARPRHGDRALPAVTDLDLRGVDVLAGSVEHGQVVVRGADLSVRVGEIVAVVGPSGTGKTTLLETIAGLRRPHAGAISANGADLLDYREADVRAQIVMLSQAPVLVGRNVLDAIRFYRDLDDAAVLAAARRAHVAVSVAHEAGGPSEQDLRAAGVSRFGVGRLSGGQMQRIGLARALAGSPSVLLLDEPSSALDAALEAELAETLLACRSTMAVILVTHRPALLGICDRVYELDAGQLRARGDATT